MWIAWVDFWGEEIVLYIDNSGGFNSVYYTKIHRMYTKSMLLYVYVKNKINSSINNSIISIINYNVLDNKDCNF